MGKNHSRAFMGGFGPIFNTDDAGADASGGGGEDQPKTFTQEELDKTVTDRLARERKKYADYEDAKAKAKRWEEAQKDGQSADQKVQDAEAKALAAEARSARLEAAINHKITDPELVSVLETVTNPDAIDTVAKLLGQLGADRAELAKLKQDAADKGNPPPPPGTNRGGASPRDRETLSSGTAGLEEAKRRFQSQRKE